MPEVVTGTELRIQEIESPMLMGRWSGLDVSDREHVRACIIDILLTPIGSRVMRRDYGSKLFQLIDRPINSTLIAQLYYCVIDAIRRWEPRFKVSKVTASLLSYQQGQIGLSLDGFYMIGGRQIPATMEDLSLDFLKNQAFNQQAA
jgi:phage baseplate assembly protein W